MGAYGWQGPRAAARSPCVDKTLRGARSDRKVVVRLVSVGREVERTTIVAVNTSPAQCKRTATCKRTPGYQHGRTTEFFGNKVEPNGQAALRCPRPG